MRAFLRLRKFNDYLLNEIQNSPVLRVVICFSPWSFGWHAFSQETIKMIFIIMVLNLSQLLPRSLTSQQMALFNEDPHLAVLYHQFYKISSAKKHSL
jgi:hypothetical protein